MESENVKPAEPEDKMKSLRAGLLGLSESSAAKDFLDYLEQCKTPRLLWQFLGMSYLLHRGYLFITEKGEADPGMKEAAGKNMRDLRKIAEMLDRCGVENPEKISLDTIDECAEKYGETE